MSGTIAPAVKQTFFANGAFAPSGSQLFTYVTGTTTKTPTYSDGALSTPNANPIVLDSASQATVYLNPTVVYAFVLAPSTDTDPPTSPYWTIDPINPVPLSSVNLDITGTAGENLTANKLAYQSDGTGGKTAGLWYTADSGTNYKSSTAQLVGYVTAAILSGSSGTIRVSGRMTGLAGLTPGALYYISTAGDITTSAPTLSRPVGKADSTTSLVLSQWTLPVNADASNAGFMSTGTQTIAGDKTFSGATTLSGAVTASSTLGVTGLITATAGVQASAPITFRAGTSASDRSTANGVINCQTGSVGNVNTGETTLFTYNLPANVLHTDGASVRIFACGTFAGNGDTKTLKMYFGAAASANVDTTTQSGGSWACRLRVVRTGATAQTLYLESVRGSSIALEDVFTGSETLSGAITVKVTATSGTASNDILGKWFEVETAGA